MRKHWVLVLATVFGAVSCTGSSSAVNSHAPPPVPTRYFHSDAVAFRFPATWTTYDHDMPLSTLSSPIVYLSNEPLHAPCETHGSSVTCGPPIDQLGPHDVFVTWSENGSPMWTFAHDASGRPISVGGHRAKIRIEHGNGGCAHLDGDTSVEVVIQRFPENWYQMSACLRGPGVAAAEAQVRSMLQTVKFG
jgi:hypothetical protein